MKVEELMLGDWVTINNNPYRIYAIKGNRAIKLTDAAMEAPFYFNSIFIEDLIKPIPLTPEILEKNGFKNSKSYSVYHSEDDRTEITIYFKSGIEITKNNYLENEETFSLPSAFFIHEFQHTLHLCGLTELANNLKIK